MKKIFKWRATAGIYSYDEPFVDETKVILSCICDDKDSAKDKAKEFIEDIFNKRFGEYAHPEERFDPNRYSITNPWPGTYEIWHGLIGPGISNRLPLYVGKHEPVTCIFEDNCNVIEYRAFNISKFGDKWYIACKNSGQILGVIDHRCSLNEILIEADKIIWHIYGPDFKDMPAVVLADV